MGSLAVEWPECGCCDRTEWTDMSELSAKSFLGLVQKSGVVPADQLKQALAELSRQAAGKPVQLDQLTEFLISQGLITKWHYEKLLTRKYKGFFVGQYKLLSLLGTGGMSTVYLAEHTRSGQRRAIKVLPRARVNDKSYLDRFLREGRAAASLNHPNIVRIYDLANEEDVYYMVMEYVRGVDLHQKIQRDGPATIAEALNYLEQAATGLGHAHSKQIVHRDIKPANLLLAEDGTVKLLDLGLALLSEEQESLTLEHNEKVMGTADYLAPEQALNSHNVDLRADIYSLGCTLYYLLTGRPPFPEGTIAQRIAMHQSREPKPIRELRPDCPPLVEMLCSRMMKKSPDERLQNCERVVLAVQKCRQALLEEKGGTAVPATSEGASAQSTPVPPPPLPRASTTTATTTGSGTPAPPKAKWQGQPAAERRETSPPKSEPVGKPRPDEVVKARSTDERRKGGPQQPGQPPQAAGPAAAVQAGAQPTVNPVIGGPGGSGQRAAAGATISPAEVGALATLPTSRARKRGRSNQWRTNLIVAAIVLFCFLVLVGMVILIARTFGS